jgi:hypothetical protein
MTSILWAFFLLFVPLPQQNASPAAFVGTWVGTQTWAIENPSPSAKEEQPIELKIDLVDGKLTGFMNPWFGGADGATFTQTTIEGDVLKATAVVGKPPAPGTRGQRGNWKSSVKIFFHFRSDFKDSLSGTADVMMNDVKWLKFNYTLNKKRSRY